MAERKRGAAENSHLHKPKKRMRIDLDVLAIDLLSGLSSALLKKQEEEEGECQKTRTIVKEFGATVQTAVATIYEYLDKEQQDTIERVESEIEAMRDASEINYENERQKFLKELTQKSDEYVSSLILEREKLEATCKKFQEALVTHETAFEDIMSKFEVEKQLLSTQDGQRSEKYKTAMSEIDRECLAKIIAAKRDMIDEKPGQEGHRLIFNYLRSVVEDAADDATEEENNEDAAGEEGAEDV